MTKNIIFATNNQHKVAEITKVVGEFYQIIPLKEAGIDIDIPEPHDSLEANATEKSRTIYNMTGQNCFSEDTGLEVDILHGEPGVRSARYAGEPADSEANIDKLLLALQNKAKRQARFRTVISLILQGKEHLFEGICHGHIATERKGEQGFGYDSIFIPHGADRTFAEMNMEQKNTFSHRKKAVSKLLIFLSQNGTV